MSERNPGSFLRMATEDDHHCMTRTCHISARTRRPLVYLRHGSEKTFVGKGGPSREDQLMEEVGHAMSPEGDLLSLYSLYAGSTPGASFFGRELCSRQKGKRSPTAATDVLGSESGETSLSDKLKLMPDAFRIL